MRNTLIVSALFLFAGPAMAEDITLPGLPGMKAEAPAQAQPEEEIVQRPDAETVVTGLGALRLSAKQEGRITNAINKRSMEFDKLLKEYDRTLEMDKETHERIKALKQELAAAGKGMPELVKEFLDEDQLQAYDSILAEQNKPIVPEVKVEEKPAPVPVKAAKTHKKRRLVKRKRLPPPAAVEGQEAGMDEAPGGAASEAASSEEGAGAGLGDEEAADGRKAPAPHKKKTVLKKKVAAPRPPEESADSPDASGDGGDTEPAAAAPAAKKSPAASAEEGSYP